MLHYERKLPVLTVFEILSSKVDKKGGVLLKTPQNHREKLYFDCALREIVNDACMQSLVSIPALLPVPRRVEFLNGDSMLNCEFCFHGFSKSVYRFSLKLYTKHVHVMLFTGKEFGVDPLSDLGSVGAKI